MEILKNEEDVLNHMSHAISNENLEMEVIFGYNEYNNPITKPIFLKLLNHFKTKYGNPKYENVSLDIKCRYNDMPSNIRFSILDLNSIQKYCVTNSLKDIDNVEVIKKSNYRINGESHKIINEDYNYRILLKKEEDLDYGVEQIENYDKLQEKKEKHYRYKKRYSFITPDQLFRIDLSVIKSTDWNKDKESYEWTKTFKEANILNNKEQYELEIEYIGSSDKNEDGIILINDFYNKLLQNIENPIHLQGSISDPSNTVIDKPNKIIHDDSEYMKETILDVPKTKKQLKEILLGKNVKIKETYLEQEDEWGAQKIDIQDDSLITIIDYAENWDVKQVQVKISSKTKSIKKKKTEETLKSKYPESFNKGFKPTDYKGNKKKGYLNLLKKIEQLDLDNVEEWIPITEIYSETDDINDIITKYYSSEEEKSGGGSSKSEDNLEFSKGKLDILTKKCIDILNGHLLYISEIIYETKLLLTKDQKNLVIKRFKSLTGQRSYKLRDYVPQPVTLNHENLLINNDINIISGYAVTEKADGVRSLLYIIENTGYLIDSTLKVISTGVQFPHVPGEWILDGEYITKNKANDDIKLYMIFDIYWNGNTTPDPAYTYPWINTDDKKPSRRDILNDFETKMREKILNKIEHITITIKKYEYGSLSLSNPDETPDKYEAECKLIFSKCKQILDKEEDLSYNIDGLILLPVRLSVKGNNMNKNPKFIGGSWENNFKWKPEKENTIDFKVVTEKEGKKDKIYPIMKNDILYKYKKLNIYVKYEEEKDDDLNFCMKLLNNDKYNKESSKIFDPPGMKGLIGSTNILLEDNKMLCDKDKSEIKDGYIVEMRYDEDGENGMIWVPLRVRDDKDIPNAMNTANNVWKTIKVPITDKLMTGSEPYDINMIKENIKLIGSSKSTGHTDYYISQHRSSETNVLNKLHNYIKTTLICGVCSSFKKHIKYMDLSCGRGGDVEKYVNPDNNIKFILGLDIEDVNEACKRYFFMNQKKPTAVFLQSDTSLNIKKNECSMGNKHSEVMLNIVYGLSKKMPKEYSTDIYKNYKNLAKGEFDVISSQFTLHYYLKDKQTFDGFMRNVDENISKGGYFIATFYDGNKVYDLLQESDEDKVEYMNDEGKLIYKIEKKYDDDIDFEYDKDDTSNMFGNIINVHMESIGQDITEYLVNLDFLIDAMKEKGLELVTPKPNHKYSSIFTKECMESDGRGSFEKVIKSLHTIRDKDKSFNKKYKVAYNILKNKELQLLSGLNVYMIFHKK